MGLFSKFRVLSDEHEDNAADPLGGLSAADEDEADLADIIKADRPSGAILGKFLRTSPAPDLPPKTPVALEATLLRALMDSLPDSIYFKDCDSQFIMVSAAFAQRHCPLGDPMKAAGKTDFDFFSHDHAKKAYEDEQRIIGTGTPSIGTEEKETWPDGHVTWALTSKFPLKDAQRNIIGTWGISRDITDHKRAREELQSSEEQLRHSQKMEAFGQLAGGIAHDFNNMLGIIIGSAQLLEMEFKDANPDLKENIDMVIDTSKRASDLTAQLLAFARKGNYRIMSLEIHEVIRSVAALLKHTLDKRVRIVERLNAGNSTIMGDYAQIQNALVNLALNAKDAMPDGGILTFATDVVGPGSETAVAPLSAIKPLSYLRLKVTDTGHGMDEATRARAFEPFFTTKPPGKGTGLGLASVFGTVKNHNGLIELKSEPNKGTTFTLFLPLVIKPEEVKPAVAEAPAAVSGKGTGTLLVVEDEESLRAIISHFLEKLGYTVALCNDGVEAVDFYKENHRGIDAIIVDMIMPRMGGPECIKKLKQINPQARILISSGYSLVSDTQTIITKGIVGFIQKPYQIEELSKTLSEVLAGK